MRPKVGWANCGSRKKSVHVTLDRLRAKRCKIIGLAEAGDRHEEILAWCAENDWSVFFGDPNVEGAGSTPILWENGVHLTHIGTTPATDARDCGPLGAGPNVVKAKVLNHVRVVPGKDGHWFEPFVVVTVHLPASLYLRRRRALAKDIIKVLVHFIEERQNGEHKTDVLAPGDYNARWTALVLRPLRKMGLHQPVRFATHGLHRTIDLVPSTCRVVAEEVDIPSDHKGVAVQAA